MQVVIDIPENIFDTIQADEMISREQLAVLQMHIQNGTPLEKHDEEVIKETVESIWGKPPYTELLDKIRYEIMKLQTYKMYEGENTVYVERDDVLAIIDKYTESEERKSMIEDKLIIGNSGTQLTITEPLIRKRTPLTVADAVIRECDDRKWLEDVIYFIKVYIDRTYTSDIIAESESENGNR